jgi:hypothetical protein
METKHDAEFGAMTEDEVGWVLERRAVFGGAQVPIEIELDDEGKLDEFQRQAVRQALALRPNVLQEAAPAVVQNYEVYREMIGDELPPLGSPVDVWQQVHIEKISVPRHYDAQHSYFFLRAECDWDEEHGLEVRFRDGAPIDASQQGDLTIDD